MRASPACGTSWRASAVPLRSSRATGAQSQPVEFRSRRKPMPAPSLPMWTSSSASRLAILGIAIMFAAIARAAETRIDPPAGAAPPPPGFVVAVLEVLVNREEQDEPIIALRDSAGRVFVAAA